MNRTFKNENGHLIADVSFGSEEIKKATEKGVRKLCEGVTVPGFRKGKAPIEEARKRLRSNDVAQATIDELLHQVDNGFMKDDEFSSYVKDSKILGSFRPSVSVNKFSDTEVAFTIRYILRPSCAKLGDYKGLKSNIAEKKVEDKDVEEFIDKLAKDNAELIPTEEPAKMGDTANIDFVGLMDGKEFEGGSAKGFDLVLGSKHFVPGFEEQVVGHNTGDEFDVNVTFPEDYHAEDLKGQPVVFKVKLNTIQEKELPALDDEFAKDVSEFDTLDELKKDVKERLQKEADKKAQVDMENSLITTVIENMEGEIPECMFENKINEMVNDFTYRLQSQGMNLDLYLHYTGSTMESFRETFKESAERQVKIRLALEKIAEVENLTATPEDIEAEYEKIAKNYGIDAQKVKGVLPEKEVIKDVTVNKAIDLVRDSADVTEKKIKKTASKSKKKAEGEATEEAASEEE